MKSEGRDMSKSTKAAKSAVFIIIFSALSKPLGFVREMLIGAKFGSGSETDTFFIALSAISLFITIITKSINTTMIPVLSEVETAEGKTGKTSHTNNLFNIVSLISILIISLAWVSAPIIIRIIAPGFGGEQFELGVLLMRIGLPTVFLAGAQGVFRGYLQSELMFSESALAGLPFNFTYIFFLVFLSGFFGIKGLMVTAVLALLSQVLLQIIDMRKTPFRYKFIVNFKDKHVKKILYLIFPIIFSVGIDDLNKIIDKALASTLIAGSISALNYANRLISLVRDLFILTIATVMYPLLSNEANKDTYDGLKRVTINGINIILLITIPATTGMIILANPIVRLVFERGKFDAAATYMTAGAFVFSAIGLVGTSLRMQLDNIYYSLQDTRTPVINGFISVVINVVLNLILIKPMAHRGLALATSISATVSSMLLIYGLRKKIGPFGFMNSVKCGLKSLTASMVMGIVVYFLNITLSQKLGSGTLPQLFSLFINYVNFIE
jgi:putative peptidoglycan lipid II flippase